ncbi:phBC6A51 family helix-turn-helix protein [Lentilactobacillus sp. Marseille-Q4993]|uniref:phBC6A51 family helix-turn-helix protein n=1 Tax=Lentilactobacillus sp. Marseille-Q4993 TaxID=3039492 RepID=UPI0024BCEB5F|nr:phBC6A51 family helix-turn-helix protein [Lentilactobacillus sp. Marseille-Q4993]
MSYKSLRDGVFGQLDIKRQKAITLLFADELSDEQIAKTVNRSRQTLAKWKKEPKFIEAQQEYRRRFVDDKVPDVLKELYRLASKAKSEMVRLQAIQTILSMAGFATQDADPELLEAQHDRAKADAKKAKAEADIAEYNAKLMTHPEDMAEKVVIQDDFTDQDN